MHLVKGGAGVIVPALIVPGNRPPGIRDPGQLRDVVGHRPELVFALDEPAVDRQGLGDVAPNVARCENLAVLVANR
jgi:hypothetical protein